MKERITVVLVVSLCAVSILAFSLIPKKVKYEDLGSWYVSLSEGNETRQFPPEVLLMESLNELKAYTDKYIVKIGLGYNTDMSNKSLLIVSLPSAIDYKANPARYTLDSVKKRGNKLIIHVSLNEEPKINSPSEIKSLFYEPIFISKDIVNKETKIKVVKD